MPYKLVIVESPTKAKTLGRFLGSDFLIIASYGHVRDLPNSKLGIDIGHNFKPEYVLISNKKEVIKQIVNKAKKASQIILATDPDREGEAIAYHVYYILTNKEPELASQISRISFHEITQTAIESALKKPSNINISLFEAQQARRILDRLVGYKLSPLLWRKVRRGLSAGRVQSVAVKLICEKEAEIDRFISKEYWLVKADFNKQEIILDDFDLIKINGKKPDIKSRTELERLVETIKAYHYQVSKLETKKIQSAPPPPLITSTLQQLAASRFNFSAHRTMRAAQSLYEQGLITYHRTDSVQLSQLALNDIRKFIKQKYGPAYLPDKPRRYKVKSKLAQEAHEAIRPTKADLVPEDKTLAKLNSDQQKVYKLVWLRSLMSQMNNWQGQQTTIEITNLKAKLKVIFKRQGVVMVFDGWQRLYWQEKSDTQLSFVKAIKVGDELGLKKLNYEQKFTQPPKRYSEATLIKVLEDKGIGRPSTYAAILQKIQQRQYVEKEDRFFKPTPLGQAVNDFLVEYFPKIMDYKFTAKMEDELDEVAKAKIKWYSLISNFWQWFGPLVEKVQDKAQRVKIETVKIGESCPECDGDLVIRNGRFGKFIACSNYPKCKYTREYVETTKWLCPECSGQVIIKKTKKGRKFYGCSNYPKCKWSSWRKPSNLNQKQTT